MPLATREAIKRARTIEDRLVESKRPLVEKFRRFNMPDYDIDKTMNPMEILEDEHGHMDPWKAVKTAMLMENFLRQTLGDYKAGRLEETSRASIPAWIKNGLALIASAQADDIIDRVISVTPLSVNLSARVPLPQIDALLRPAPEL